MEPSSSAFIRTPGAGTMITKLQARKPVGINKADLQSLIESKSSRLALKVNDKKSSKSDVWSKFQVILLDGVEQSYVKCVDCDALFVWTSHLGTGSLIRHKCTSDLRKDQSQPLTTSKIAAKKCVTLDTIQSLNETIVRGLCSDMRPMNLIGGRGFARIAQAFVDFGAQFGTQNISDFVRDPSNLKRKYLPEVYHKLSDNIKSKLFTAPTYPKFCFTTDMWSDDFKKRHYLSLTAHFLDEHFKLCSYLLTVCRFPDTIVNIRDELRELLDRFFPGMVDVVLDNSVGVTDGGSNMNCVFPTRYPCQCHKLNLVLQCTFSEPALVNLPKIRTLLSSLKKLVTFFKQSGLNSKLSTTLKQDVPTRWNSTLIMLESYVKVSEEIETILIERNELNRLVGIDDSLLHELVQFLHPFKNCSEELSAERTPTLQLIAIWYSKLRQHLNCNSEDSDEIVSTKSSCSSWFDQYCVIEPLHYAASVLNPRFRRLKFATEESRVQAYSLLKELVGNANNKQSSPADSISGNPPASKKQKTTKETFDEFADSDDDETQNNEGPDEVDIYLKSQIKLDDKFNILKYWAEVSGFPGLRKISQWLLCIQASSAASERTFSERRTQIGDSVIEKTLFIHHNDE